MLVNIGKDIELDVDVSKLGFTDALTDVEAHVAYIGLRNILMDSHASVTAEKVGDGNVKAESLAIAQKKLDALYNGELRTLTIRTGDPVKREAIRLVVLALKAKDVKEGRKTDEKANKALARELIEKADTNNKFMVRARANVEAEKALEIED